MAHDETKEYEISFLGRDESGAAEVARVLSVNGGEVFFEGPVERIELAYKIDGMTAAHFGYFHFRALPEAIAKVEDALRNNQAVLRTLVLTPPVIRPKPRTIPDGKPRVRSSFDDHNGAPASVASLSNEALEKKIEEILK